MQSRERRDAKYNNAIDICVMWYRGVEEKQAADAMLCDVKQNIPNAIAGKAQFVNAQGERVCAARKRNTQLSS